MFEGISAKTAALFGVCAGMALSIAAGFRPGVQFDMKVNFLPSQNKDESVEPANIQQVPSQFENQQSPGKEPCPACGMG
jgi:hypothetical protein